MKILIFVLWFLLCFLIACTSKPEHESINGQLYHGTHLLRQIQQVQHSESHIDGGYFLFAGGISGASTTDTWVTFAWKGNDDQYRFMTLPLEKVHIYIDNGCVIPYVRFKWQTHNSEPLWVVIGVNSKDWPERIQVPLQP